MGVLANLEFKAALGSAPATKTSAPPLIHGQGVTFADAPSVLGPRLVIGGNPEKQHRTDVGGDGLLDVSCRVPQFSRLFELVVLVDTTFTKCNLFRASNSAVRHRLGSRIWGVGYPARRFPISKASWTVLCPHPRRLRISFHWTPSCRSK